MHEFQHWLKNANFSYPHLLSNLIRGDHLSNLWKSSTVHETKIFQVADGKDVVILACTVFD